jgi:GR25 family glycosyltransferase involved in LPS biosynthesis
VNEYCIISIDDSRAENKDKIRAALSWNEAKVDFVNGKDPSELRQAKEKWRGVETPGPFKAGEFGIFYSVLNAAEYGAKNNGVLYFEDDAIITDNFQNRIEEYIFNLPVNADLLALWSPDNQAYDYENVSNYNALGEPLYDRHTGSIFDFGDLELCRLWQGYGNVGMYLTKQGCYRLINYIGERGFFSPIDCLICIASHTGRLNSFSLKPSTPRLIDYNWDAPTTIHRSRWGMLDELIKENNE